MAVEILISLDYESPADEPGHPPRVATAAVYRRDDGFLMTGDLGDEDEGGLYLEDRRPGYLPVSEERSIEGGLAPPDAAAAEVVTPTGERLQATVGNGAWMVLVEHPATWHWDAGPVVFRAASGEIVRHSLPADWPRSPVAEVEEPCPGCGGADWEEVRPGDGSHERGAHPETDDGSPPFVFCALCGHQVAMPTVLRAEMPEDPEAPEVIAAARREWDQRLEEHRRRFLDELDFPLYAVPGWPRRLAGQGFRGESPDSATVAHGRDDDAGPRFSIETEREDPLLREFHSEAALAREALTHSLWRDEAGWPHRSEAGMTVWHSARGRAHRRIALEAKREVREFSVDGAPRRFEYLAAGDRWVAVARVGDLCLTITARGVEPYELRLERVPDPGALA